MNEPTRTPETGAIAGKLAKVIAATSTVPETGYNSFHKYKYVTEADLVRAIREELSAQGVCFIPSIVEHERTLNDDGKTVNFRCLVEYTFVDSETGQGLTVGPFWGEGEDKGDKAGYKAMTGALKYCLRQTFLVPTGEDPEADKREKKAKKAESKPAEPPVPAADWSHENKRFRALVSAHPKRAHEAMKRMVKVDSFRDVHAETLKSFNDKLDKVSQSERAAKVDEWCKGFKVGEGWEPEPDPEESAEQPGGFTDDEIPF